MTFIQGKRAQEIQNFCKYIVQSSKKKKKKHEVLYAVGLVFSCPFILYNYHPRDLTLFAIVRKKKKRKEEKMLRFTCLQTVTDHFLASMM